MNALRLVACSVTAMAAHRRGVRWCGSKHSAPVQWRFNQGLRWDVELIMIMLDLMAEAKVAQTRLPALRMDAATRTDGEVMFCLLWCVPGKK